MMRYCYVNSPIGKLFVAGDEEGLRQISFPKSKKRVKPDPDWVEDRAFLHDAVEQLERYFQGKLKKFRLKLAPAGTPFQLKALKELQKVPYGETVSYGELARRVGNPKACRAVGGVNARNPLAIVIPCHRVVGSNGNLTGFGGGLDVKQTLLDHEQGLGVFKKGNK